jgi:hypothetical protein
MSHERGRRVALLYLRCFLLSHVCACVLSHFCACVLSHFCACGTTSSHFLKKVSKDFCAPSPPPPPPFPPCFPLCCFPMAPGDLIVFARFGGGGELAASLSNARLCVRLCKPPPLPPPATSDDDALPPAAPALSPPAAPALPPPPAAPALLPPPAAPPAPVVFVAAAACENSAETLPTFCSTLRFTFLQHSGPSKSGLLIAVVTGYHRVAAHVEFESKL